MEWFTIILSVVFLILALIHFNWARGGRWGFENSIPTDINGKKLFNPGPIASTSVGVVLLFFSVFYFSQTSFFNFRFPDWFYQYGGWGIPSIFLLRSIGNFKYVGIFKSVKDTLFAKSDTRIFVPLCLLISLLGFLVRYSV